MMLVRQGADAGSGAEAPAGPRARRARATWIYGPGADLLMALCWIPLFVVGHVLTAGHGPHDDDLLRRALAATFVLSFLHQPLTLGLVYGDREQFRQHRALFLAAPVATVAVVVVAVVAHLWVVIPIAAVWNTVHTLQERYGLSRIYARRSGYGSAAIDRWILYGWMVVAALVVAADPATPRLVTRVSLDGVNAGGVGLLTDARPVALVLLVPAVAVALWLTVALVRQELGQVRCGAHAPAPAANPAKWVYQGASILLIASIAVDPAAGFIAYVGAHAIEYFVVVYKTSGRRYAGRRDTRGVLARASRTWAGRVAALAAIVALALVAHARLRGDVFDGVLYTVGVLHFLYDGVIWKLRTPAVAADFSIGAT